MHSKWKRLWQRRHDADLPKDRPTFSQQQSPSFMSAVYDRTVRTDSYNDFVLKIDVLTGEIRAHNGNADLPSSLHTSGLLEPSQETVDDILQCQIDIELPEMMKMAIEFFENSRIASTLCGTLLQSIDKASDQCRHMEVILAGLPHSGEALGFMQQRIMAESLSEMVKARNPFTENEAGEMFADVGKRYGELSGEVEERRKVVGRKVRVLRRWRGGCIAVVVAVVVGATVVAVVVSTHMAVTMATVPVVAVAAVARSKSLNERNSRSSEGMIERCSRRTADGVGGSRAETHGVEGAEARGQKVGGAMGNIRPKRGGIRSRMCGLRVGAGGVQTRENLEGAGAGRVEVELGIEMRGSEVEMRNGSTAEMGSRGAELAGRVGVGFVGAQMSGIGAGGARMGGVGLEEAEISGGSGNGGDERSGVCRTGAAMGGREAKRGGEHQGCFCWGLGRLTRQGAKLDALARGSFTVNRMLDTLRCLVTGLQDDVERNRKLVEFGWSHREEAQCVQQVGKQLFRSHSHMVRQLANLQEQVVVCFLIINKARDIVLQEFSP